MGADFAASRSTASCLRRAPATGLLPRTPFSSQSISRLSGFASTTRRCAFQSNQPQPQDGLQSPGAIRLPLHAGLKPQAQGVKAPHLPKTAASNGYISVETAAQAASYERVPLLGGFLSSIFLLYKRFEGLWGSFLPMVGLFFFLSFINTILDSLKDTFVITAVGGGAQVIPYLTVYAVLPSSLLFLVAYSYATTLMSRSAVFNTIIGAFMSFFAFFGLFLFPNHQALHLHGLAETLHAVVPSGLAGAVGMVQNWTFTLFFCIAELWGDVCLSLLFWGLANDTTSISDASTLYPLFGLGANLAQAMAGIVLKLFSHPGSDSSSFSSEVQGMMLVVMCFSCVVLVLHNYIISRAKKAKAKAAAAAAASGGPGAAGVLQPQLLMEKLQQLQASGNGTGDSRASSTSSSTDSSIAAGAGSSSSSNNSSNEDFPSAAAAALVESEDSSSRVSSSQGASTSAPAGTNTNTSSSSSSSKGGKKGKKKARLAEVWRILLSSVEIRCLAVMSIAQGLCTSLMDFAWKCHIKVLYPSPSDFTAFLGDVATWTGVVTGALMLLSPLLFDRLGWRNVAAATPQILTYGGGLFFAMCIAYQWIWGLASVATLGAALPVAVLNVLVVGGALLYVFSKGAKFSLFKPAEEMVYIGMDEEGRTKGKAAIDVVGAQTGKSAGSVLQQALLIMSAGSIHNILPVMLLMFLAMCTSWIRSVDTLAAHHDFSRHFSMPSTSTSSLDEEALLGDEAGSSSSSSDTNSGSNRTSDGDSSSSRFQGPDGQQPQPVPAM